MKNILLIGLLFNSFGFADAELDIIVEKIQKERDSLGLEKISVSESPFVSVASEEAEIPTKNIMIKEKKKKEVFILNGLINEKAFINGVWHKVGDVIFGYEIRYIGTKGVVLTKFSNGKQQLKKIFMESRIPKNKRINFFEG